MVAKLRRYISEIRFAFRSAATLPDAVRLSLATLAFHIPPTRRLPARRSEYGLRLNNRTYNIVLRSGGSGDMFVFYEVLHDAVYRLTTSFAAAPVVLDLGANIGMASIFFDSSLSNARLIAVEPDPDNYAVLQHNLKSCVNATCYQAAVTDRQGSIGWHREEQFYAGHIDPAITTLTVPTLALADIIRDQALARIDVLKIDVEGSEHLVLADSAALAIVQCILIELHAPHSLEDFRSWVEPAGFHVYQPGSELGNCTIIATRDPRNASVPEGTYKKPTLPASTPGGLAFKRSCTEPRL